MTEIQLTLTMTNEQLAHIADQVALLLAQRSNSAQDDGYLNAAEAAKYLATTRDRVYDLKQMGKLPALQDGRRLLFRKSDLDEYLEVSS